MAVLRGRSYCYCLPQMRIEPIEVYPNPQLAFNLLAAMPTLQWFREVAAEAIVQYEVHGLGGEQHTGGHFQPRGLVEHH